jgi:hypothetical protein
MAEAPVAARAIDNTAPENPDNWYGLDYVHDRISVQLREQSRLWEEADGRLRLILGVIGVVFAATLGLLPRGSVLVTTPSGPMQEILYLPFWVGALAVTAFVLFSVAGFVALVAYWPRTFSWPPAPESLREYVTSDEREIKLLVVDAMLDAYAANGVWLARKFQLFRFAFGIAALAAGILGASVIIEVLQFTRAWS